MSGAVEASMRFFGPEEVAIATERPFQLVDVTDRIAAVVATSGLAAGSAQVWCPHTSCGLAVTEMEDGLHADVEALAERLAPIDGDYVHDDLARRHQNLEPDERRNGWSHLRALLLTAPTVVVPVVAGGLALGQWQRLFLVELDGPRRRRVSVQAWGRAGTPDGA
ncbi:MAG TPA: secondary thiamine-phosphate synthase enzyme YjbQ [Acidimicrobiales bacterium]|nr:secondary thiamine-phosphate synthase enzyme YjbQ [Acidimicrobiales bacterium]